MNLTPEQREVGRDNFYEAVGVHRRDFLKEVVGGVGVAAATTIGGAYFGYKKVGDPLRIGVIGTGDEGNVLLGALNPEYQTVVAISDIRPSSIHRAFHGDYSSPEALAARPGLMSVYGWKSDEEARRNVKVYDPSNGGYQELLKDPSVEAVVIALPLHLHAKVAIEAMNLGKHVLTEKLMAHNVAQCKIMARVAREKNLIMTVGHQRHYNILYDNAVKLLQWGILGEVHHIRAQWHRGNLPGNDSWQQPLPGGEKPVGGSGKVVDKIKGQLTKWKKEIDAVRDPADRELMAKKIRQWEAWDADKTVKAEDHGYISETYGNFERSALEELVRWRLFERTGGGLMAELGSHQLDAASIFISALRRDGKKAHPLTVHAVGGRQIFPRDRDSEDHVYCLFEFPGPGYDPGFPVGYYDPVRLVGGDKGVPSFSDDPEKRIVVMYSSINGNGFGGYGEVVMGTRGTLIIEREKEAMLIPNSDSATRVGVKQGANGPTLDTQASGQMAIAKASEPMNVSRGYKEELEHWAYCIRNPSPENQPRCRPEIALGDAAIALTANIAIDNARKGMGGFVHFKEEWFDVDSDEIPSPVDAKTGKPILNFAEEKKKLLA